MIEIRDRMFAYKPDDGKSGGSGDSDKAEGLTLEQMAQTVDNRERPIRVSYVQGEDGKYYERNEGKK